MTTPADSAARTAPGPTLLARRDRTHGHPRLRARLPWPDAPRPHAHRQGGALQGRLRTFRPRGLPHPVPVLLPLSREAGGGLLPRGARLLLAPDRAAGRARDA